MLYIPSLKSFEFGFHPLIMIDCSKEEFDLLSWFDITENKLIDVLFPFEISSNAPIWDRVDIYCSTFRIRNLFLFKGKYLMAFEEPSDPQNFLRIFDQTLFINGCISIADKFQIKYSSIIHIASTTNEQDNYFFGFKRKPKKNTANELLPRLEYFPISENN